MSKQLLQRASDLAMAAAISRTPREYTEAVGRLRTLDRLNEVPASTYLTMDAVAAVRAGNVDRAKEIIAKLWKSAPGAIDDVREGLLAAPEAQYATYRRVVDGLVAPIEQVTKRRSLRRMVVVGGVAALLVAAIALSWRAWVPRPEESESQHTVGAVSIPTTTPSRLEQTADPDVDLAAIYELMSETVGKVVVRWEVLRDDGASVMCPVSIGTGFVVSADGLVLTNRHVIEVGPQGIDEYSDVVGWDVVVVFGDDGRRQVSGAVMQQSATVDLAWIRTNQTFDRTLRFGGTPVPGSSVRAYGFPGVASDTAVALNQSDLRQRHATILDGLKGGNEPSLLDWIGQASMSLTVSSGIVSALHETETGLMLQTDAFAEHGSSGGPLLDDTGRVVGMVTLKSAGVENANFCIAARTIFEELAREPGVQWPDTF